MRLYSELQTVEFFIKFKNHSGLFFSMMDGPINFCPQFVSLLACLHKQTPFPCCFLLPLKLLLGFNKNVTFLLTLTQSFFSLLFLAMHFVRHLKPIYKRYIFAYMIYKFFDHSIPLSFVILGSIFAIRDEFDIINETQDV